jgi:hypothetical protein
MRGLALVLGALALTGCEVAMEPPASPVPQAAQPGALRQTVEPAAPVSAPSARSAALREYYTGLQNARLTGGLLRTDGGGPDTPYTDTMLVRNFARIALEEEYVRGAGLRPSGGADSRIKKWLQPVRMVAEFGPSVPVDQAVTDRNALIAYARRLASVTNHPVSVETEAPNFHVLFVGVEDLPLVAPRVRALVPDANARILALFDRLPRSIHCLVLAFSREPGGYEYGTAIAVIRAEHPDLMRLSCIHEEVAQGLGLANDSPLARPSIFNDDDEFALLTRHDADLLTLLYDPALRPGMTPEEALRIVETRATALVAGGS